MKRLLIPIALLAATALAQAWGIPPYNLVVTGGVTAVRAGYGLTFSESPLVDTGTVIFDTTGFKTWLAGDSINFTTVEATRARVPTIYTTNIFPTAATTHLLFALTASTSLDSVRFKATVVRVDSLDVTAITAANFRGPLTGLASTASSSAALSGTWKTLDTTDMKSHTLAGTAASATTAAANTGTWKTKDTTYFGRLGTAASWTAIQTFTAGYIVGASGVTVGKIDTSAAGDCYIIIGGDTCVAPKITH